MYCIYRLAVEELKSFPSFFFHRTARCTEPPHRFHSSMTAALIPCNQPSTLRLNNHHPEPITANMPLCHAGVAGTRAQTAGAPDGSAAAWDEGRPWLSTGDLPAVAGPVASSIAIIASRENTTSSFSSTAHLISSSSSSSHRKHIKHHLPSVRVLTKSKSSFFCS